jgi:hypothetical protein
VNIRISQPLECGQGRRSQFSFGNGEKKTVINVILTEKKQKVSAPERKNVN